MNYKKLVDEILESTYSGDYPDNGVGGPASDDDGAPGTTVFGDKMVPVEVPNRLTGKTIKYVPAADLDQEWNYDEFDRSKGMGTQKSYSKTLDDMKGLLGDRLWKHTNPRDVMKMDKDKEDTYQDSEVDQTAKLDSDDEETANTKEIRVDITEKINAFLGNDDIIQEETINEMDISFGDRKTLSKAILGRKNVQIKIKSLKVEANVTNYDDEIVITYKKNDDFTLSLVEIADSLGMEFKTTKDGGKEAFRMMR